METFSGKANAFRLCEQMSDWELDLNWIISHDIFDCNFTLLCHKTPQKAKIDSFLFDAKAMISTSLEIVKPLLEFRGQVCGIDTNRWKTITDNSVVKRQVLLMSKIKNKSINSIEAKMAYHVGFDRLFHKQNVLDIK